MTFDLITADAMGSGFADHWCSVNDGVSGFVAVGTRCHLFKM